MTTTHEALDHYETSADLVHDRWETLSDAYQHIDQDPEQYLNALRLYDQSCLELDHHRDEANQKLDS